MDTCRLLLHSDLFSLQGLNIQKVDATRSMALERFKLTLRARVMPRDFQEGQWARRQRLILPLLSEVLFQLITDVHKKVDYENDRSPVLHSDEIKSMARLQHRYGA